MQTKRVILITVIVAAVLVGIAALASYLIVQSKEQEHTTSGTTTGATDASGNLLTSAEIKQLEEQLSTGEAPSLLESASQIQGGASIQVPLEDLFYDAVSGVLYATDPTFGEPVRITEDLQLESLFENEFFVGLTNVEWYVNETGEWQVVFSIDDEDEGAGQLVVSEAVGQVFLPGYTQSIFTTDGTLLSLREEGNQMVFDVIDLEEGSFTAEEYVTVPTGAAQVQPYGATNTTIWYERFDTSGRSFRALDVAIGEETVLVKSSREVIPAPTRTTFLVTRQQANVFFTDVVAQDGTTTELSLPATALPIYAWDKNAQQVFFLVGEEGEVVEETDDDTIVSDPTATELWQMNWKSGASQRVSLLPEETQVSQVAFDGERVRLFLYSTFSDTLTIFAASDTTGEDL
ncbi:MAG: hypothetical protein KC653_02370 [Candidatus Andersenbacteria bacterium]|nr:hypothetical protein [Candidatus Andersenbacteria bacterium]